VDDRKRDRAATSANVANINANELRELMRAVTERTERLHATHTSLQQQVARLQQELAEANAALRRSQALAALGEMAAGIAHEVRNPLGSIQLYVQMLAEDLADRPAQTEVCRNISSAVTGLDGVVRDVLAFARDTTIDPLPISVDRLFDRDLNLCHSLLADVNVQSEIEKSFVLHVDAGLMTQALGNVIRNGVEAMAETKIVSPKLKLRATRRKVRCSNRNAENCLIMSVHDSGPGIPDQVIGRIFNPFFTTRATGTGLGLAIVHRIIDAHGGHINIQNPPEGGALVELCIPVRKVCPSNHVNQPVNTNITGDRIV
jgi:signal transduction histidine kinase